MAWAPDYVTTTQLKSLLRITDTGDDTELAFAITAASRAVDAYCGRQFGVASTPVARYYEPSRIAGWPMAHVVVIDDLMTTVGLVVNADSAGDGTFADLLLVDVDFRLWPWNAAVDGRPWTRLVGINGYRFPLRSRSVRVTASWGWTSVPAVVTQATLIQASRLFMRRNAPFGVAGSPDIGSEMRLLSRLDPDVCVLLSGVRHLWAAA